MPRLILGLKFSDFLSLKEGDFHSFEREVEKDSLFQKLAHPPGKGCKVISCQRPPWVMVTHYTYQIEERVLSDQTTPDIQGFFEDKDKVVRLIRRLGLEKFNRYFLLNEEDLTIEEVASACRLTPPDVRQIYDIVNEISIFNDFSFQSKMFFGGGEMTYNLVAGVEKTQANELAYNAFSPSLAKGKYRIDFDRIKELREQGYFSKDEKKRLNKLLQKLRLINMRKSILLSVLEGLLYVQKDYLLSGDSQLKKPFSQRDLARQLRISPSWLSRVIRGKGIETPWREKKPLRDFFVRQRERNIHVLEDLLRENDNVSDRRLREIVEERFRISVSRRTIASYRKTLGLTRKRGRKKEV